MRWGKHLTDLVNGKYRMGRIGKNGKKGGADEDREEFEGYAMPC